jgi:hypothetical protein
MAATPSAVCTVADGLLAAVSANNVTVQVTCGNLITVALNSSSGVQQMSARVRFTDDPVLQGLSFSSTSATSFTFQAPNQPFVLQLDVSVTDYFNNFTSVVSMVGGKAMTQFPHFARLATAAALAAYTAAGGVLTANANGAMATVDGVAPAVGDRILLTAGAAAADNGLYVVTSLGGASAKFVLTRAPDWYTGAVLPPATTCEVSEGTLYAQSTWKNTTAGFCTVDTSACTMYPRMVSQSLALVAGTTTITNVPILSATKTLVTSNRTTANTTASTITYQTVGAMTPGLVGTASLVYDATVAAGTINAADVSTLTISVFNW